MRLCGNLARYILSYYIHWMNLPSYKPLPSPLLFCRTHSWKLSSLQGFRLFWPVFRWEFVCHSESLIFLLPRWVFVSGVRLFLCKGPLCLPKNKTMKKLHTLTELINNMADETTNGIIVMFPHSYSEEFLTFQYSHFTSSLLYVCKAAPCCDIAAKMKLKSTFYFLTNLTVDRYCDFSLSWCLIRVVLGTVASFSGGQGKTVLLGWRGEDCFDIVHRQAGSSSSITAFSPRHSLESWKWNDGKNIFPCQRVIGLNLQTPKWNRTCRCCKNMPKIPRRFVDRSNMATFVLQR